jgi:hypothetical protein
MTGYMGLGPAVLDSGMRGSLGPSGGKDWCSIIEAIKGATHGAPFDGTLSDWWTRESGASTPLVH